MTTQNDSPNADPVDAQLAELQNSYIAKLDQKLQDLIDFWIIFKNNDQSKDELHPLYRAVHSIAGTSSTLNICEVSRLCSNLEIVLLPMLKADSLDANDISSIELRITELSTLRQSKDYKPKPINLKG
ncbi:MAG: chemotaxis protein histidine kinase CheA [Zhongshania sp.]|jgi:chemotaxis protein histidine kinase CheA